MGPRSKPTASPRVISSLVLCTVLLGLLMVAGNISAIEPSQEAVREKVEMNVWSPSSWMAWLEGWLTGDLQVTQGATSTEPCTDPECSPPDAETTTGGSGGGEDDPMTEQGPVLDVTG